MCRLLGRELLNTNFADVRGGGGLLLCGPKRTRKGEGGIDRFFADVLYGWYLSLYWPNDSNKIDKFYKLGQRWTNGYFFRNKNVLAISRTSNFVNCEPPVAQK